MLCCGEIFFHALVFNASRFSRLRSQTRLITKQKEIDVKSVYLNLGSDKMAGPSYFPYFLKDRYEGNPFESRKINCW